MKKLLLLLAPIIILASCIPDKVKEQMDEGMLSGQQMILDQEFKKAISHIELHKLRNGDYPNALSDLEFLTLMDSSMFAYVQYFKHDSLYELNLTMEMPSFSGKGSTKPKYPQEFWYGLGCVKSNLR